MRSVTSASGAATVRRAERRFAAAVPARLMRAVRTEPGRIPWQLAHALHPAGRSWSQVFGPLADQAFMAWYYARYAQAVAHAGQRQYALPMDMNAQLPAPQERAGHYPSGGPYPLMQPIYRAGAAAIDFYAPDIYWPDFEHWLKRYRRAGNPAFVPESRPSLAPFNALYVFGGARGFRFSAFGVHQPLRHTSEAQRELAAVYGTLRHLAAQLLAAQRTDCRRAFVLHLHSPRPEQTLALGGYLFRARLARSWKSSRPLEHTGAMLLIERRPGEFDLPGMGLTVTVLRDPDVDRRVAGIGNVERFAWHAGQWRIAQRLNGDQTNQDRQILLSARCVDLYRVRLYSIPRQRPGTPARPPSSGIDAARLIPLPCPPRSFPVGRARDIRVCTSHRGRAAQPHAAPHPCVHRFSSRCPRTRSHVTGRRFPNSLHGVLR